MLLDIVILPPDNVRKKVAKALKRAIAGVKHEYVIDNRRLIPHLSLLHLRVERRNFFRLAEAVQEVVSKYKPFKIRSTRTLPYPGHDRVSNLLFQKTPAMKKLNQEIVLECNGFRSGPLFWWYRKHKFGTREKKYIQKYGSYWSVEKNFNPHFTLARTLSAEGNRLVIKRFRKFKMSFIADTIALCRINTNGQVTKILKTFKMI